MACARLVAIPASVPGMQVLCALHSHSNLSCVLVAAATSCDACRPGTYAEACYMTAAQLNRVTDIEAAAAAVAHGCPSNILAGAAAVRARVQLRAGAHMAECRAS